MRRKAYLGLFAILVLAYLALNLLVPPNKAALAQYHLSSTGARAISISVVIPITITWLVGLYGSLKMKGYVNLIKDSKEYQAFGTVTTGLFILVLAQPITSVSANLTSWIIGHRPGWHVPLTIINNYVAVIATGIGLVVLAIGACQLASLVKHKYGRDLNAMTLVFIILSSLYSYAIISQPIHTSLGPRVFYMPNWLVLATIAIPYLFVWFFGFMAAYCLYVYQKKVRGLVYKGSLIYVAAGIATVVLSSIAVRFLTTISFRLSRLSLTPVLFIIYAFLALAAIGFILIAWGAAKLRRIEEV